MEGALKNLLEGPARPLKAPEILVMSASDCAYSVKFPYVFFRGRPYEAILGAYKGAIRGLKKSNIRVI